MLQSLRFWLQLSSYPPWSVILLALSPLHPFFLPIFSDNTIKELDPWQSEIFPDPSSFPMFWSRVAQWSYQPIFSGPLISLVFLHLLDSVNASNWQPCVFPVLAPLFYQSIHATLRDKTAIYRTDPRRPAPLISLCEEFLRLSLLVRYYHCPSDYLGQKVLHFIAPLAALIFNPLLLIIIRLIIKMR